MLTLLGISRWLRNNRKTTNTRQHQTPEGPRSARSSQEGTVPTRGTQAESQTSTNQSKPSRYSRNQHGRETWAQCDTIPTISVPTTAAMALPELLSLPNHIQMLSLLPLLVLRLGNWISWAYLCIYITYNIQLPFLPPGKAPGTNLQAMAWSTHQIHSSFINLTVNKPIISSREAQAPSEAMSTRVTSLFLIV